MGSSVWRLRPFVSQLSENMGRMCFPVVQVKDREAYYIDLQLLRVTKKLQAVLKGDRGDKDKELVQKTEARVEMMERSHESKARTPSARKPPIALSRRRFCSIPLLPSRPCCKPQVVSGIRLIQLVRICRVCFGESIVFILVAV